jgi:uncharacterized protein (DUF983 family)
MRSLPAQLRHPCCPRCGDGKLFRDMLTIVDHCSACGLDLKYHDAADGPTFFALIMVGFLITVMASVVEMDFAPPLWVHALLWLPLTVILCIAFLRLFKTAFVTIEYRLAQLKENPPHD